MQISVIGYSPSMNGKRPESAGCLWEWSRPKYIAALRNNRFWWGVTRTVRSESVCLGFEPRPPHKAFVQLEAMIAVCWRTPGPPEKRLRVHMACTVDLQPRPYAFVSYLPAVVAHGHQRTAPSAFRLDIGLVVVCEGQHARP